MGERVTVVLDDGASELLLKLAGSSRRQGEYLSGLIRAAWEYESAGSSVEVDREACLLYTSPSPRDGLLSRMPSSA